MSNRLFQGVVHQMRDTIDRTIGIVDEGMSIIACSDLGRIGEMCDSVTNDSFTVQEPFVSDGYTFKTFGSRPRSEYIVFVEGTDEQASKYASLLSVSFASIKQYYDENTTVPTSLRMSFSTTSCRGYLFKAPSTLTSSRCLPFGFLTAMFGLASSTFSGPNKFCDQHQRKPASL